MKKFVFLILLGGFTLSLNSCTAGYVAVPPTYVEFTIPPRPGINYIWIEGGWVWDNHRKVYVQKRGHWVKKSHAHRYPKGQWKKHDKGYRWERRRR